MRSKARGPLVLTLIALVVQLLPATAQVTIRAKTEQANSGPFTEPPRLIVGIVVDQMRFDYLTRFWDHYGDDGFRRMVGEGFFCRNHHFNYAPTSTGPGHASVYTGTTPAVHGIIGNNWFDKELGAEVYCAGDTTVQSVGTSTDAGQNSPHRMLVSTVTDQLRLHYQMRSKVIAVALKDRGAVLPGGHTANAAYWFEGGATGNWISSSYYMPELPEWVREYNASDAVESYRKSWEPLEDLATYLESGLDNVKYESPFVGEQLPIFPHNLPALWDQNGAFEILRTTPFGNSLTLDFALVAMEQEDLGEDSIPDFLAISFSSTDYVGHKFGVDSKEIQDTYIRLDRDLARLFKHLDRKVGKDAYTVFLTADHGALPVPAYLADQRLPASYTGISESAAGLQEFLQYTYGTTDIVRNVSNNQIFLDHKVLRNLELTPGEVQETLAEEVLTYKGIAAVYTASQMMGAEFSSGIPATLQQGFSQKRSGDILFVMDPSFAHYSPTGSTHGSVYTYDTHVPLLFMGHGIRQGDLVRRTEIPDIAPTLSAMLGIAFPSGATGKVIPEALD